MPMLPRTLAVDAELSGGSSSEEAAVASLLAAGGEPAAASGSWDRSTRGTWAVELNAPPSSPSNEVASHRTSARDVSIQHRQRKQWQHQYLKEQILQREPWRLRAPVDHHAAAALQHARAPAVLFNGQTLELPGPGVPLFSERAGGGRSPRADGGRWPPAPPGVPIAGTLHKPFDGFLLDRLPAGASSSVAFGSASPATPAGQESRATAQRLGAAYVRAITPRPNVSRPAVRPPTSSAIEVPEVRRDLPGTLFSSEMHLDEFMGRMNRVGGSLLTLPMVGHAPIYDPRRARADVKGGLGLRASQARASPRSPRRSPRR